MALDLLWLAVVFLVIALVAYALGARNFAWFSAGLAKIVFWVFIVLFIIALLFRFLT